MMVAFMFILGSKGDLAPKDGFIGGPIAAFEEK